MKYEIEIDSLSGEIFFSIEKYLNDRGIKFNRKEMQYSANEFAESINDSIKGEPK